MTTAAEAVEHVDAYDVLFADYLADKIKADLKAEHGRWVWDPYVDGVVGFEVYGKTVVILYLEAEDFEVDDNYAEQAIVARQRARRRW